jgi:hypothetical protein
VEYISVSFWQKLKSGLKKALLHHYWVRARIVDHFEYCSPWFLSFSCFIGVLTIFFNSILSISLVSHFIFKLIHLINKKPLAFYSQKLNKAKQTSKALLLLVVET